MSPSQNRITDEQSSIGKSNESANENNGMGAPSPLEWRHFPGMRGRADRCKVGPDSRRGMGMIAYSDATRGVRMESEHLDYK